MEYEKTSIVKYYKYLSEKMGLWNSEAYIFNNYISKDSKILDLGCGIGRTTFGLYNIGFKKIIGLDISQKMIDICKEKCKSRKIKDLEFICGDAEKLNFESNIFDCVFFSFCGLMTINKEQKRIRVFQETNRVLKNKGLFIFTTYDREKNVEYLDYWKKEKIKWDNNKNNKKYEKFGDRICNNSLNGKFIHVPIYKEVEKICNNSNYKIIWSGLRSQICNEPQHVIELSDDCIFYIAQKY